jgi:hypothetical protein
MARIRRSVLALTGLAFAATGCAQAPAVGAEGQAAFARIPSAMGTTTPSGTPSNGLVVVVVRVRLTGGPMRRDGGMALNHSPANGQRVTATGAAGRRAATTDAAGEARLRLPLGDYTIGAECSAELLPVVVRAGTAQQVTIDCYVP